MQAEKIDQRSRLGIETVIIGDFKAFLPLRDAVAKGIVDGGEGVGFRPFPIGPLAGGLPIRVSQESGEGALDGGFPFGDPEYHKIAACR